MAHTPPRIGVIVIPIDPYWVQALEAIQQTNRLLGDELVLIQPAASNRETYAIPPDIIVDQVLAEQLDAMIIGLTSPRVFDALRTAGVPVISLSEEFVHLPGLAAMASLYPGARMVGQYIGEKLGGKGHAVCVTAELETIAVTGQSRLAGFRDALKDYPGISLGRIPAYWSYDLARDALKESLKTYPTKIDALFGVSDPIVLAARDVGLELGIFDENVIFVGLNGDPLALAAVQNGELSATVDISSETLGERAMKLAHAAALGAPLPYEIPIEFDLITRENVASIAIRKLAAVAHIPDHMVGYNREKQQTRLEQMEISIEITRQIDTLQEREQLIQVVSDLVTRHYRYEWVRILSWSQESQTFTHYGGISSPPSCRISFEEDKLLNDVIQSREAVQIPDTRYSYRWHPGPEWDEVRSRVILPIHLGDEAIGVLDLQSAMPVTQLSFEMVGLKLLANQLGIVMRNVDLYQEALKARQTAEYANQLKNRLIANVGHEMRTPLNAIMGFSQSILKQIQSGQEPKGENLQQDVQHIYKSGDHLMHMINDLLDLSRAEIGALNLYFEQINPVPFLNEVFESLSQTETPGVEVSWRLEMPERLPVIRADVVRLRQILVNLLVNARKFTQRGSITLGALVEPPYLHLWVRDTGSGVPLEYQERIFEPFSSVTHKRRTEGMGLGLSITRHLVALHNGLITLESQPGLGSLFNIYLPLPGIAQNPLPTAPTSGQPVMLVISNQASIPDELQRICAHQKMIPVAVANRDDLSRALQDGRPTVLAWDLATASTNEWNLIHLLSQDVHCSALPMILFSGNAHPASPRDGLTDIVFKPCQENIISSWIDQASFDLPQDQFILIVDDDPQAREHYFKMLHTSRPQSPVRQAENGREALMILKEEVPALILLDLMMPDVDGFAVLEAVRQDPRTQFIPVIIMSGKLLNFEDVQRLNHLRTAVLTKGILDDSETLAYLEKSDGESKSLPQPTSVLVKQVLAFLHQNYPHPINRTEMADAVGVSENYLSQIFRQEVALSPMEYLTRFRIQKAKKLLRESQESITQVASRVGFNDSAYFSRVFHKSCGCSPQDFRRSKR